MKKLIIFFLLSLNLVYADGGDKTRAALRYWFNSDKSKNVSLSELQNKVLLGECRSLILKQEEFHEGLMVIYQKSGLFGKKNRLKYEIEEGNRTHKDLKENPQWVINHANNIDVFLPDNVAKVSEDSTSGLLQAKSKYDIIKFKRLDLEKD